MSVMRHRLLRRLAAVMVAAVVAATGLAAGQGTPGEAAALLAEAAAGDVRAQVRLGIHYSEGSEAVDLDKARLWFQKAAEQGDAEGQRRLARLYDFVDPAIRDTTKAAHWYTLAANQSDAIAQNNLGNLYFEGDGVPQSAERGLALVRLAATQGLAVRPAEPGRSVRVR